MAQRTTIMLDEEARKAAKQLALRYDCSTSEAIRRAIVQQRDAVLGVDAAVRRQRKLVLRRLFDLFEGSDPEADVRRLKQEDEGF